jgi:hypothetical protein
MDGPPTAAPPGRTPAARAKAEEENKDTSLRVRLCADGGEAEGTAAWRPAKDEDAVAAAAAAEEDNIAAVVDCARPHPARMAAKALLDSPVWMRIFGRGTDGDMTSPSSSSSSLLLLLFLWLFVVSSAFAWSSSLAVVERGCPSSFCAAISSKPTVTSSSSRASWRDEDKENGESVLSAAGDFDGDGAVCCSSSSSACWRAASTAASAAAEADACLLATATCLSASKER